VSAALQGCTTIGAHWLVPEQWGTGLGADGTHQSAGILACSKSML